MLECLLMYVCVNSQSVLVVLVEEEDLVVLVALENLTKAQSWNPGREELCVCVCVGDCRAVHKSFEGGGLILQAFTTDPALNTGSQT